MPAGPSDTAGPTALLPIRNVAIIAHVDHGKTTLVDAILRQTGTFRQNEQVEERVLDSNELERERGITILAKNTAVFYQGVKVNIVDTPGHADFGGEVERILSLVDGALLVVDAFEGPMPQTRFVLQKALQAGLKPLVVINKIDRPGARPLEAVDRVLDLFIALGADDEQIEFPVVYASAKAGVAYAELPPGLRDGSPDGCEWQGDIRPLLDAILVHVPPPRGDAGLPLQCLVTTLDYDDYIGRIAIGRVANGRIASGATVAVCHPARRPYRARVSQLFTFSGLKRVPAEGAAAGEIVAMAGIEGIAIGETVADPENPIPLPPLEVDEPTLTMTFRVNDSPFAGREGVYVTSRHLRDRLFRETLTNVGLVVRETDSPDAFEVSGRGELHLSILIERMRREGYELAVSKPRVIFKEGPGGERLEPLEHLVADVPDEFVGTIMERIGSRRGELQNMAAAGEGITRLEFIVPARGLVGFAGEFLTDTKGLGVMSHTFHGYGPDRGPIPGRNRGSLVAWEAGIATTYALLNAQERGTLFIGPGTPVYGGMVVGQNAREQDLDINVCKAKHVTNMRSSTAEEVERLTPPRILTLEQAIEYIGDDELVEVTPESIRVRKAVLDRHARARQKG